MPAKKSVKPTEFLSLDAIREADDILTEDVHVPEWNGWVQVRGLTKREMREIRRQSMQGADMSTIDFDTVEKLTFIASLVQPKLEEEAWEVLQEKSAKAIGTIQDAISRVSGMDDGAIKEAEKTASD